TLGESRHCARVVLSSSEDGEQEEVEQQSRFKASAGAPLDPLYGIRLAASMGFPQSIVATARQVASEQQTCKVGTAACIE
ncbi:hypothetical protein H4R99_008530, partial [Coemansia sp. RSA 1722]